MSRVAIIGLDSLPPQLIFERWRDRLPTLARLMDGGTRAVLRSCTPPITVPAWSCMLSGRDPGQLGIYGFRNRRAYDYGPLTLASSHDVRADRVWDVAARAGLRSIVIGVPGTYPPPPIQGALVSDLLTPSRDAPFTHPAALRNEVEAHAPAYRFDVVGHRGEGADGTALRTAIHAMTSERFRLARHLARHHTWDLFVLHEIGPDRMHHAFWAAMDPAHPRHEPGSEHETAILDYYRFLDGELEALLTAFPPDADVLVVSDHGAQPLLGGFRINELLLREGWLALNTRAPCATRLDNADVDWEHTLAWGEGGYYARIFLNLRGREPRGALAPANREAFLAELRAALMAVKGDDGEPIVSDVLHPEEIYLETRGVPPDLLVVFREYAWRSLATVGTGRLLADANDTGPDEANHAVDGIFVLRRHAAHEGRSANALDICDVAPTVLNLLGVPVSDGLAGRSALEAPSLAGAYTPAEEATLTEQLRSLGYL